jgi:hypothetical protein
MALDQLGQHLSGSAIYHGQLAGESVISFDISQRDSVANLLGNMLFLQDIWVPPFGSDAPLWSLSYEFWYYLLFPLFLVAFVGSVSTRRRIAYVVLGVAILLLVGPTIDVYFLLWLLGAGVAFTLMRRPGIATSAVFRVGLAAIALSLVAVSFTPSFRTAFGGDVLWAFATAALIVLIQSNGVARERRPNLTAQPPSQSQAARTRSILFICPCSFLRGHLLRPCSGGSPHSVRFSDACSLPSLHLAMRMQWLISQSAIPRR